MRTTSPWILGALIVLLLSPIAYAQSGEEQADPEQDDLFADPLGDTQDSGDSSGEDFNLDDVDSFFEDSEMIDEVDSNDEAAPETDLLVREDTRIGGRFSSRFEALSIWEDYPGTDTIFDPTESMLVPEITARIFVDARPEDDFRFYSAFDLAYPFSTDAQGEEPETEDPGVGQTTPLVSVPSIEVFELFSDFTWRQTLFFRVGKSVVNWGVGYFFSPADVISLTPIDPEDPEADREGPVSFRTHLPFDVHNAYLSIVAGETIADDGEIDVNELTIAPRLELFFAGVEYGLGAFYQKDLSPRGIATVSTSIWDFDVFGEGVVSYGSDRVFLRRIEDPVIALETYTDEESLYFQGTAGFRYSNTDLDASIVAQYYFNGEGYEDQSILDDARASIRAVADGQVPQVPIDTAGGTLTARDLGRMNRHYASAVANLTEVFGTDLSAGLLWQGNLADGSGLVGPSLTYSLFERASVTASTTLAYGPDDREFTSLGGRTTASISVSLGGGSF